MTSFVLITLLAAGPSSPASPPAPAAATPPAAASDNAPTTTSMRAGILTKLAYDLEYFSSVLALKAKGSRDSRLSKDVWEKEVRRSQANVPLLQKLMKERDAYEKQNKPFSLPSRDEAHRVYANLISLLNMLQAYDAHDFRKVLSIGERIVVQKKEDLGVVRGEDSRYYLNLYREYFWFMAAAHYRLGNDREAIAWLSRIDSDTNVQELRKELGKIDTRSKSERLAQLFAKSVAILPPVTATPTEETKWLGNGFAEVFTSDLYRRTNLVVMERANIDKVFKEIALSQAGLTEAKNAKKVAEQLAAGSLIRGIYVPKQDAVDLTLELVDGDTGEMLAQTKGEAKMNNLFRDSRGILVKLLTDAGWLSDDSADELMAERAPSADAIKNLLEARLLLASKSEQAKALYKKALKDSPEYAKAFEDVQKQFKGVNPLVAVMPLSNVTQRDDDQWMSQAATEVLSSDLPNIGFTLVERAQLAKVLQEQAIAQATGADNTKQVGEKLGADFVFVGSVMHQGAYVRVDGRFVDVTTGIVVQSFTAEGRNEEYPKVLSWLSSEIARRFNVKLSEEELKKLAGNRMTREELERIARAQLLQDRLVRVQAKEAAQTSDRMPSYIALGSGIAGVGLAVTGFLLAGEAGKTVSYIDGALPFASVKSDIDRLDTARTQSVTAAGVWTAVGIGGSVIAVGSAVFVAIRSFRAPPEEPAQKTDVVATPSIIVTPNGAALSLSGSF